MKGEVKILGAGLVGSLLTLMLARRGYRVKVFERRPDMRIQSAIGGRSINLALSDRGWRGLDEVGLRKEIGNITIPMQGRMVHSDGQATLQPYGKTGQAIHSVSRATLNKTLIAEAEKIPGVSFCFNERCMHVDLFQKKLFFENQATHEKWNEDYEMVIGADGAFSALRYSMQFLDRYNYLQQYIEHGYKELSIPPVNGDFALFENALHIWPRKSFMLIALPNLDKSFTCTLFFPFEGEVSFSGIKNEHDIEIFFQRYFPDVIPLMPSYISEWNNNPASSLITVKCFPWTYENSALLIGDAAHAIVPFFGQGMNCGFEDCTALNSLLNEYHDDWSAVLPEFQDLRKINTDAIAQLALDNFIEMRDLVTDPHFIQKKKIEKMLIENYPDQIQSAYSMVSFSPLPYAEALRRGKALNELLEEFSSEEIQNLNDPQAESMVQQYIALCRNKMTNH